MSDQPTDNGESLAPVPAVKAADRTPMTSGGQISAIVPRDHVEAFRFAEAFVHAGMIPPSYGIKRNAQGKEVKEWEDGTIDVQATKARLAIGIMKGMEIGLPPVTALSTICVINNRPCLWGDGAVALVQKSGKCEWTKDHGEGDWTKGTYIHHFTVKRLDSAEEVTRSFGFVDAKAAGLTGKKGPWSSGYGPRMCMNRARAWALRDAFSDVLLGIGIAEEVRDIPQELPDSKPDISSLDDAPAPQITYDAQNQPLQQTASLVEEPQKDALDEAIEGAAAAQAEKKAEEYDPDWVAVLDQLKPALHSCENMAQFQMFWLDNIKTIESIDKAPENIKFMWQSMISAQQGKFAQKGK